MCVSLVRLHIIRSIDRPRFYDLHRWIKYRPGRHGWYQKRWTINGPSVIGDLPICVLRWLLTGPRNSDASGNADTTDVPHFLMDNVQFRGYPAWCRAGTQTCIYGFWLASTRVHDPITSPAWTRCTRVYRASHMKFNTSWYLTSNGPLIR